MKRINYQSLDNKMTLIGMAMILATDRVDGFTVEGWNEIFDAVSKFRREYPVDEIIEIRTGENVGFRLTDKFVEFLNRYAGQNEDS